MLATLFVATALAPQDCVSFMGSGADDNRHVSSIAIDGREMVMGYPYLYAPGQSIQRGRVKFVDLGPDGQLDPVGWLDSPGPSPYYSQFGNAVALDGDVLAVTCPGQLTPATAAGAVFVFRKDASGAWAHDQTLLSPLTVPNGTFAGGIALEGDRLVVGSPGVAVDAPAKVFSYRDTGNGFVLEQTIDSAQRFFGTSVAMDGDTLLVGSSKYNGYYMNSSATFFDLVGGTWVENEHFTLGYQAGYFTSYGREVAVEGDLAIIAAPKMFNPDSSGYGVIFVMRRNAQGAWEQETRLFTDRYDPTESPGFGQNIALDRGLVVSAAWFPEFDRGLEVWGQSCDGWHRSHVFGGANQGPLSHTTTDVALSNGRLVTSHYTVVRSLDITCTLGRTICDPNPANATGLSSRLRATGSEFVVDNALVLEGSQLPQNSVGLVLFGQNVSVSPFLGCLGELCLGSPIARGSAQPLVANANGEVTYAFDAMSLPAIVGGGAVTPGDTWTFQYWHRNPDAARPVALSNAVSVTFE